MGPQPSLAMVTAHPSRGHQRVELEKGAGDWLLRRCERGVVQGDYPRHLRGSGSAIVSRRAQGVRGGEEQTQARE